MEYRPLRRRLPDERRSLTHKFSVAGHSGYITVGQSVVVGRAAPSDVCIPSTSLSRSHARFELSEGELRVADLGSTNGTLLAGQRVTEAVVRAGDEVVLSIDHQPGAPTTYTVIDRWRLPLLGVLGAKDTALWFASTKNGSFVAALITLGIVSLFIALGMKTYARIQKVSFYGGMIGLFLVLFWVVLALLAPVLPLEAARRAGETEKVAEFVRRREALLDSLSPSRREHGRLHGRDSEEGIAGVRPRTLVGPALIAVLCGPAASARPQPTMHEFPITPDSQAVSIATGPDLR